MTAPQDMERLARRVQVATVGMDARYEDLAVSACEDIARAVLTELLNPSERMVGVAQGAYAVDYEYAINDEDMKAAISAAIKSILDQDRETAG